MAVKNHKKILVRALVAAGIVISVAVCSTMAYLYFEDNPAVNNFSIGSPMVEVIEDGVNPDSVEWGTDTKPVALSVPQAENAIPCVVRAMMVPCAVGTGGETLLAGISGVMAQPEANRLAMGDITLCFEESWSENWFFKDGFFYYNKVLNPGETTPKLLSGVILTEDTEEKRLQYQNVDVKIDIIADALQASSSAPREWGLTVSGTGAVSAD